MAAPLIPSVRLVVHLEKVPASLGTDTYRWSTEPLADTEFTEGRIALDSWGALQHLASTLDGHYEGASLDFEVLDTDGTIGALLGAEATSFFMNREASLELLSTVGRAASLAWRPLITGKVTDLQPSSVGRAKGQLRDTLGAEFSSFNLDRPLGRVLIGAEHYGCPIDTIGRMYPHIVGEHSDEGSVDAAGGDAAVGAVPLIFVGYQMIYENGQLVPPGNEALLAFMQPPSGLTALIVGTPGTTPYTYAVSAIVDNYGETAMSFAVSVTNGPTVLDASNYIRLSWIDPPLYGEYVSRWRIHGRRAFITPTRSLSIMVDTGTNQYEDKGQDSEKLPIAPDIGTAQGLIVHDGVLASGWGKMLVGLGAVRPTALFASDLGGEGDVDGGSRGTAKRVRIPLDHPDVLAPYLEDGTLNPSWPLADPWLELTNPQTGQTIRATYIAVRGPMLNAHLDGSVTMAVNVCGWTASGGGGQFPTIGTTDDFTRANETTLTGDGNWGVASAWYGTANGLQVVGNAAASQAGDGNFSASYRTVKTGPDLEMTIPLAVVPTGTGDYVELAFLRDDPSVDATPNGYTVYLEKTAGGWKAEALRLDGGAQTVLGTVTTGLTFANGDTFGIRRVGATISAFKISGGVTTLIGSVTDATYINEAYQVYVIGDPVGGGNVRIASVAGGTAGIVDTPGQALKMYLNEIVLKNAGEGYSSGAFGPLEVFENSGVEILRTSSFDDYDVKTRDWVPPYGYRAQWYIDDKTRTLRAFLQQFCQTFGCFIVPFDYGQIGLAWIDELTDLTTAKRYREHYELLDDDLPRATILYQFMQTQRAWQTHWLPDRQAYRNPVESIRNATAEAAMKTVSRQPPATLAIRCSNDRPTVADGQARQLAFRAWPIVQQSWTVGMQGLEQQVGQVCLLTHRRGGGRGPYNAHPFLVTGKAHNLNTDTFVLTGLSLARILGLGTADPGPSDPVTFVPVSPLLAASDLVADEDLLG